MIAAGQKWTKVWEVSGNNADGILADKNGDLLIAQNHNSAVVKLDKSGKVSTVYKDTHTGGALSMNKKGELFIVERGLRQNVTQLAPKRRVFADKLPNGDPLDCLGGVINDLTADSKGGVYFTMGGLFYADAKGIVTRYGENLDDQRRRPQPGREDALRDERPHGGGIRRAARRLSEEPASVRRAADRRWRRPDDRRTGPALCHRGPRCTVVAPDGKLLGSIPAPYGLITAAFAGKDKKTMYAVVSLIDPTRLQHAYVYSIPMSAQGYKGRAK